MKVWQYLMKHKSSWAPAVVVGAVCSTGVAQAQAQTVAAADTFIRERMKGQYKDLMAVVEFGDAAYVVTPFTNDYDNVLLSVSLIGEQTARPKDGPRHNIQRIQC